MRVSISILRPPVISHLIFSFLLSPNNLLSKITLSRCRQLAFISCNPSFTKYIDLFVALPPALSLHSENQFTMQLTSLTQFLALALMAAAPIAQAAPVRLNRKILLVQYLMIGIG